MRERLRPALPQCLRPIALDRGDGREDPHPPQRLHRAERQVEAGGVGAIDDVDVVIAGRDQRARRELRKRPEHVEEFRPFGGGSRVRHVAGDEHEIERPFGMDLGEPSQRAPESGVAARARASALDPHPVAFADDVHVGEVRDAEDVRAGRRRARRRKLERLVGGRVGDPPNQRRDGEIGGHDDDRIGDRRNNKPMRRQEIGGRSDPLWHRPRDGGDQRRDDEQKDARRRAARRAHPRELRSRPPAERPLGEMTDRLAPERVAGLHRERVQRPEIRLGEPEQRAPTVVSDSV